MICVSLAESNPRDCIDAMEGLSFAEVRIDAMEAVPGDMYEIFHRSLSLIATFRPEGSGMMTGKTFDDKTRKEYLIAAIKAGAAYVDIEAGAAPLYRDEIIHEARLTACRIIISHHDLLGTPPAEELLQILESCFEEGADIAKIACLVKTPRDNIRLLRLLDRDDYEGRIIVVGMGAKGRITRVSAPLLGSPFTFASSGKGKETAGGQMDKNELEKILGLLSYE